MNTQTILAIAAKHSAYADSRVCIRGQDDIVAFVKELLAAQPVRTRTTIHVNDFRRHQDEGAPLKAIVEINPEPLNKPLFDPETARSITKTAQEHLLAFAMLIGMTDEQCDETAGIPTEFFRLDVTSEQPALQRQRDYMLESLRRIAAAPIDHGRYAELVRAAAKETVEFIDSGVL